MTSKYSTEMEKGFIVPVKLVKWMHQNLQLIDNGVQIKQTWLYEQNLPTEGRGGYRARLRSIKATGRRTAYLYEVKYDIQEVEGTRESIEISSPITEDEFNTIANLHGVVGWVNKTRLLFSDKKWIYSVDIYEGEKMARIEIEFEDLEQASIWICPDWLKPYAEGNNQCT